ncbi:hydrogenase/urease maturation nickel metallochaperone HypA [Methanolapillus millepedarum]|uniref:Hydrogenase maturation factor HypA n=1 Tax=Methanolapillus millepedarum TaxID=3028296 RepID=A0AA96V1W5_9EURY|nr:Hydrogenase maturation factor HypA [Methanosarcinaceae archaeon Ac7]
MHEYSLAMDLMENVLTVAHENDAAIVNKITVKVGKLAHVNPVQLEFCLQSIAEETIAKNAIYVFEPIAPDLKCTCGYFGKPKDIEENDILDYLISLKCPNCGKDAEIIGGRDLMIDSIDID